MDTGDITVGAIMIALCLLPFILMANNRRKKKNEFQAILLSTIKSGDTITKSEFAGHFMIGVDQNNRQLYFVLKKDQEFESKTFDLKDITSCRSVNNTKVNPLDKENPIIESILLEFSHANKSIDALELFHMNNNKSLSGELQIAQHWEKIINEEFLNQKN